MAKRAGSFTWSKGAFYLAAVIGIWASAAAAAESETDSTSTTASADSIKFARPVVHLVKVQTVGTQGEMIDPGISAFIERAVRDADAAKVDAILFEIDTFGGRVDAATLIKDAILDAEPLTIAFIDRQAISAGALISLACDQIVMVAGAEIGAVTPVTGSGEKAEQKIVSAMRAEMRATAEATGRDSEIAEAMVDESIDIPGFSNVVGRPATLTTAEALHYGIADETAESVEEVLRIYDLQDAVIVEVDINWAERVVRFLTNPIITSILMSVAIFGLIAEVRTPGWGLGGTMALLALALFFGSHLVVHLAEWDELLLFVVGLILLLVEIAFIPGFGLVGLAGILCMVASLLLTRLPSAQWWQIEDISGIVGQMAISMIVAIVASVAMLKALPRFAVFNRLVLGSRTPASEGYVSAPTEQDSDLIGREGVALSELRPVGVGLFDGKRIDIIAEGEFIEAQSAVKIVEARGNRTVVRPA
jgi:membrane-bound serine protease (ClpP class)